MASSAELWGVVRVPQVSTLAKFLHRIRSGATQRLQIDHKAVLHVTFVQAMPCFLDFIGLNQFDLGTEAMTVSELHHLARVGDTANQRTL